MDKGYRVIRVITVAPVLALIMAVLVFVASMRTNRHTFSQLIGGGLVPLISMMVIGRIFGA